MEHTAKEYGLGPLAALTGIPGLLRSASAHPEKLEKCAVLAEERLGLGPGTGSFVIVWADTENTVAAYRNGRLVDCTNPYDDGPFSLTSCGALPAKEVVKMCFDMGLSKEEVIRKTRHESGILAHTEKNTLEGFLKCVEQEDSKCLSVLEAMVYQISKEAGAMASVLEGRVDALVMAGCMAKSEVFLRLAGKKAGYIGPILVLKENA